MQSLQTRWSIRKLVDHTECSEVEETAPILLWRKWVIRSSRSSLTADLSRLTEDLAFVL